jgi:hypothetical protein
MEYILQLLLELLLVLNNQTTGFEKREVLRREERKKELGPRTLLLF